MTTTTNQSPEQAFSAALAEFQHSLPHVGRGQTAQVKSDKGSYSYDYADLATIVSTAAPLLAKCGLSFTARPMLADGNFLLRYALLHSAGHREEGDYPLPDPTKFGSQVIGSAITYARRYALCALTGIAPGGDDDDGAKAVDARSAQPRSNGSPAPVTPASVRAEIAALAKQRGVALGEISDEFAVRECVKIGECQDVEVLQAFLRLVRDGELTVAAAE